MEESMRGRPKKFKKPVFANITFEQEKWWSIQRLAQRKGIPAAELVRTYIEEGLAKEKG